MIERLTIFRLFDNHYDIKLVRRSGSYAQPKASIIFHLIPTKPALLLPPCGASRGVGWGGVRGYKIRSCPPCLILQGLRCRGLRPLLSNLNKPGH